MIREWFTAASSVFGIDLGHRSMKIARLSENQPRIEPIASVRFESGSEDEITESLSSILGSELLSQSVCVVSLPREDVCIHTLRLPCQGEKELRKTVAREASSRFDLDPETMEVDYIRTGAVHSAAAGGQEVVIYSASHRIIDMCLRPLIRVGLKPVRVETNFSALARYATRWVSNDDSAKSPVAVLDLGARGSTLIVVRESNITLCRPIALGDEQMTRSVGKYLNISMSSAAKVRALRIWQAATCGRASSVFDPEHDRELRKAVHPVLLELIEEISIGLWSDAAAFHGLSVDRLLLTGCAAHESGFAELVAKACHLPVTVDPGLLFDSQDRIRIGDTSVEGKEPASAWSVAVGLCLGDSAGDQSRRSDFGDFVLRRAA